MPQELHDYAACWACKHEFDLGDNGWLMSGKTLRCSFCGADCYVYGDANVDAYWFNTEKPDAGHPRT